jgi:hypothetical protein
MTNSEANEVKEIFMTCERGPSNQRAGPRVREKRGSTKSQVHTPQLELRVVGCAPHSRPRDSPCCAKV